MVDIVVNHNGWAGDAADVDYSIFNPFNQESYYHPYCTVDYSNITSVRNCWLGDHHVELVDLATEDAAVTLGYQTWIRSLVDNYTSKPLITEPLFFKSKADCPVVDGLRVDTAYEVNPEFWSGFQSAAGVFITGEYDDSNTSVVCGGQEYLDSVLNYPV